MRQLLGHVQGQVVVGAFAVAAVPSNLIHQIGGIKLCSAKSGEREMAMKSAGGEAEFSDAALDPGSEVAAHLHEVVQRAGTQHS